MSDLGWATGDAGTLVRTAPIAYLAVTTAKGPHVTPQLLGLSGDRLWFATAVGAVKVTAVRRCPAVAVCAWPTDGSTAAVLHGDAHVLDPARPVDLARSWLQVALGPAGVVSYVRQHAVEVSASLADLARGAVGRSRRVLVSVQPDAAEVVDVPDGANGVLAWVTPRGLAAVPVRWDEHASTAVMSPGGRALLDGAETSAVAVACDRSSGPAAADRAGAMHRGTGRLDGTTVHVDVTRVTTWSGDGVETRASA